MFFNSTNSDEEATFGHLKDDRFDFDLIEMYFRKNKHSKALQVLSDQTCSDLDFNELFMFVDRSSSKIGQQYLYNRLRVIPEDMQHLHDEEEIIEQFTENKDFRQAVQKQLKKLDKMDSYYIAQLFQEKHIKPPAWFKIVPVLSFTSVASLLLLPFIPQMLFVLLAVFVTNLIIHYWNKNNLNIYLSSVPELLKLNKVAHTLYEFELLKKINPKLPESFKALDKIKNRMAFIKLESSMYGDLETIFWSILELVKTFFLIEPLMLFGILKQIDTKRKEIENVYLFTGKTDTLLSIASLRAGLDNFCIPVISSEAKSLEIKQAYHPLIKDCVKNSIQIDKKSILLTGSNMSGKTSFIRTIGINAITSLTLNTSFSKYFSLPHLKVYSAIRISDDLLNDKSYYFEEVLRIKEMIHASATGTPNLFLLDEIYKGTNTIERVSAGKAVLSSLAKHNSIVFVSTHDIELAELLKKEYELYHFSESVNNNTVDFDYRLKSGKLTHRNAIRILQINDYPEEIITEAIQISQQLDQQNSRKLNDQDN